MPHCWIWTPLCCCCRSFPHLFYFLFEPHSPEQLTDTWTQTYFSTVWSHFFGSSENRIPPRTDAQLERNCCYSSFGVACYLVSLAKAQNLMLLYFVLLHYSSFLFYISLELPYLDYWERGNTIKQPGRIEQPQGLVLTISPPAWSVAGHRSITWSLWCSCLHFCLLFPCHFCDSLCIIIITVIVTFCKNKEIALSAKSSAFPTAFVRFVCFNHFPHRTAIHPSRYSVKLIYCG